MAFGELAFALDCCLVALGLAVARALPDPGAEALFGRGFGGGALGTPGCAGGADELHHHRDRAGNASVHQQRLEEQCADVDPRPFGDPEGAVECPVDA